MGGWGGGWLLNGRLGAVQVKVLGGTFHLLALAPVPALPEVCFRGRLVPPRRCPWPACYWLSGAFHSASIPTRSHARALPLFRHCVCRSLPTRSASPGKHHQRRDWPGRAEVPSLVPFLLFHSFTLPRHHHHQTILPPRTHVEKRILERATSPIPFSFSLFPLPFPPAFLFLPGRPPLRYPPPSSHSALVFFGRSTLHASLLSLRFDGSHSPDTHESRRPSAALALTPPCPTSPTSARSP